MDEDWDSEEAMSSVVQHHELPQVQHGIGRGRLGHAVAAESGFSRNNERSSDRFDLDWNRRDSREKSASRAAGARAGNCVDDIEIEARQVSAVIGRQGATVSNIREKCSVRIDVPRREEIGSASTVRIKISGSSWDDVDRAKSMIRDVVGGGARFGGGGNDNSPFLSHNTTGFGCSEATSMKRNHERQNFGDYKRSYNQDSFEDRQQPFNSSNNKDDDKLDKEEGSCKIDWAAVRAQPLQNMNKFKDHPPVLKDFYIEDDEVRAMTLEEVKQFRRENFDITVELFKKEDLSYGFGKHEVDTRTPEEIEAYLFENVPKPVRSIEQAFKHYPEIMAECKRQNFREPTPIQSQMWPILLKGLDCIGIAQTGTGKTLAFLLPALIHIDKQITPREKRLGPNVLVLSPTRELAVQIEKEVKKINYKGIKSVCVYGGVDRKEQINICTKGVEIIIATPGRLYDLIQGGVINVTSVTYLVMDEADRMLDMGFEPQIMKILLDIRPDRQTVMTSATWPVGVRRLATKYLLEPIQLYVGTLDLRAAKTVNQVIKIVQSEDEKKQRLLEYITSQMDHSIDKLIVFVGRKSMADNLSCDLVMKNIVCQSIHGDREQLDREEALEDFKTGAVRILIATDVASRGIDVKDITCVLNYDFPRNIEEYVHRVGRTGRAGRTGTAVTFVGREDWKHAKELIDILKQGDQEVPEGLVEMAERYEIMKIKRAEENKAFGGGFGGSFRSSGESSVFGGAGFSGGGRDDRDRGRRGRGRGGRGGRDRDGGGGFGGFYF